MPKRIRTFVAIELPGPVRHRLAALADELADVLPSAKWVEPENIHLTLKFLGDVDDPDLYTVCKTAQQVAARFAPFEIAVAGVGAFPDAQRPRIIWGGVTAGGAELMALQGELDRAFSALGYPHEERPFTPHITLGRARRGFSDRRFAEAVEQQKGWRGGELLVEEILVFSSQLGPDGPTYTIMGRGELSADSSPGA
jgi:2'-5' RNA ligase